MSPGRVVLDSVGENARMPNSHGGADPHVETIHGVAELSKRPCRKMGPVGMLSLSEMGPEKYRTHNNRAQVHQDQGSRPS